MTSIRKPANKTHDELYDSDSETDKAIRNADEALGNVRSQVPDKKNTKQKEYGTPANLDQEERQFHFKNLVQKFILAEQLKLDLKNADAKAGDEKKSSDQAFSIELDRLQFILDNLKENYFIIPTILNPDRKGLKIKPFDDLDFAIKNFKDIFYKISEADKMLNKLITNYNENKINKLQIQLLKNLLLPILEKISKIYKKMLIEQFDLENNKFDQAKFKILGIQNSKSKNLRTEIKKFYEEALVETSKTSDYGNKNVIKPFVSSGSSTISSSSGANNSSTLQVPKDPRSRRS